MKKFYIIIVSLLISISLTACNSSKDEHIIKAVETKDQQETVINITAFYSNSLVETAAKRFEELNPGIKIEINEYSDGGSSMKERNEQFEKYRYNMSTELMSGKGPDIIGVRGLPYKKYINMDMLVDMGKLMDEDKEFNKNEYYSNVFEALKYKDGLYTLPLEFYVNLIADNADLLSQNQQVKNIDDSSWEWKDFFNAVQTNKSHSDDTKEAEKYTLFLSDEDFFVMLFQENYKDFINEETKTASFTSQEFIDCLNYCKQLSDDKLLCKNENIDNVEDPLFFIYPANVVQYMANEVYGGYISDFYRVPSKNNLVSFGTNMMYGINNNSNNKAAAWKFMKFLFSYETQSSPELFSLPVNKRAFENKLEREFNNFMEDKEEFDKDKSSKIFRKCSDKVVAITEDINSIYSNIDPEIIKIVNDEIHMFFSEEKTAEETSQIIQNKVSTYLQEQY